MTVVTVNDALATGFDRADRLVEQAHAVAERRFGWDDMSDGWQAAHGPG